MKFKVGSKYIIRFHDHCKGEDTIDCEVMLKIIKQDKLSIVGTWWIIIGENTETEEANTEMMTIIKSTIIKKREIS
jgi:hypothetical protein